MKVLGRSKCFYSGLEYHCNCCQLAAKFGANTAKYGAALTKIVYGAHFNVQVIYLLKFAIEISLALYLSGKK